MGAAVAWFEILSNDHERAQKFYSELFGWTVSDGASMAGYGLVDTGAGEGAVGGGIGPADNETPAGVKIYMKVDDLDAYLARAEQLGGKKLVPPTPLPGDFGAFAIFVDPDGNQVGLWK
jgi:predicted enzyme related to lactoylglutathione lyase